MTTEIKNKIQIFIDEYFIKDSGAIWDNDSSLIEEGIIDSVGVMELVAFLEVTFNFRVADDEINPANLDSVNKLVTYVQSKLTNQ